MQTAPVIIGWDSEYVTPSAGQLGKKRDRTLSHQLYFSYPDDRHDGKVFIDCTGQFPELDFYSVEYEHLDGEPSYHQLLEIIAKRLYRDTDSCVVLASHSNISEIGHLSDGVAQMKRFRALGRDQTFFAKDEGKTIPWLTVLFRDTYQLFGGGGLALLADFTEDPSGGGTISKIVLPDPKEGGLPWVERMDQFMDTHPKDYLAYAMRNAELSAKGYQGWAKTVNTLYPTVDPTEVTTAGGVFERHYAYKLNELSDEELYLEGYQRVYKDEDRSKYVSYIIDADGRQVRFTAIGTNYKSDLEVFDKAYHGGRQEAFWCGLFLDDEVLSDWDISSAYPSAMISTTKLDPSNVRRIDRDADRQLVEDYIRSHPYDVGAFTVRFKFKEFCRYPMLPVKGERNHGN